MKLLKQAALAVALTTLSQASFANGYSIGVILGQSSLDEINDICTPIPSIGLGCGEVEDSDTAVGLNLAFHFTDIWGAEIGYIQLGEFSTELTSQFGNTAITVDADLIYTSGVVSLPFNDQFSVSARLGAFKSSGDVSSSGLVSRGGESFEDDVQATGGVSLDYKPTDHFSIQVRYDKFDDFDMAGVGLNYHF